MVLVRVVMAFGSVLMPVLLYRFELLVELLDVTGILTVLFSFSRGAFIGFLAMVLYMWAKTEKKLQAGLAIVGTLVVFFAIMPPE